MSHSIHDPTAPDWPRAGEPRGPRRPTVVIVGRPNVGKSTLVNRIIGRRSAIVEEKPGVTRDRKSFEADFQGRPFDVVDTGGWMPKGTDLDDKVSGQSIRALADADLVVMVVDVTVGITDLDDQMAAVLRPLDVPKMVVANKVDDEVRMADVWAFARLGLGEPHAVSALHGRRAGDLVDAMATHLDFGEDPEDADDDDGVALREGPPGVVIVGRPNVGKSTLFNRLIGDERSVVHDMAGTTRDAIDTVIETEAGPIRFIDTAGLRRRARVDQETEFYANVRALDAVDRADAALLVIDATEGVTHQDQRLAERVDAAGCPIVVLLNKWETLDAEARADTEATVADRLRFLDYSPVLKLSALTGKGVNKLMPALTEAIDQYHRRVPTADLNRVVREAQAAHPHPGGGRVLYATQGASNPPTITLFANRTLDRTYLRYLENQIRERFEFGATPLKLRVRQRAR